MPELTKPPEFVKVAPAATSRLPVWVNGELMFSVPDCTLSWPLLLNAEIGMLPGLALFQWNVPALLNVLVPTAFESIGTVPEGAVTSNPPPEALFSVAPSLSDSHPPDSSAVPALVHVRPLSSWAFPI